MSSTEARVLIDFPGQIPDMKSGALENYLLSKIMPQLPKDLQKPFEVAVVERKTLQSMPNRRMIARPQHAPGAVMLGDSLNMRHPLTGGGMTVAFTDCELLSSLMSGIDMNNAEAITAQVNRYYATRGAPNRVINILADALYDVFSQKNEVSLQRTTRDGLIRGIVL